MIKHLTEIRRARFTAAACALALACVAIPAGAQQNSTGNAGPNTAQEKPATEKSSAQNSNTKASSSSSAAATKATSATHTASAKHHSRRRKSSRVRGQKKIDPERARTIQEALIREHYLSGEPTGTWNQASEDAMRRYQSNHGWQTKEVPDSRALISLGLGPSKDHLLNPESAMTTGPQAQAATAPASPTAPAATPAPAASPSPSPAQGPSPSQSPTQKDPSSPQ
jgi:hypothetical protein